MPDKHAGMNQALALLGIVLHLALLAIHRRMLATKLVGVFEPSPSLVERQHYFEPRVFDPRDPADDVDIETVLVISSAPFDFSHAFALWTILECVTSGIDKVLISAPDAEWSREVVPKIIEKFKERSRYKKRAMNFELEVSYHINNRYDVGLWCDGLSSGLGFDGNRFHDSSNSTNSTASAANRPRAIFLINDSAAAMRKYDAITEKIARASRIEQLRKHDKNTTILAGRGGKNLKLLSLNGDFSQPWLRTYYWVESVYRGLTPDAIPTFFEHSCGRRWRCRGRVGNNKKECIVNAYERDLVNAFDHGEVGAMFPSYIPKEWDHAYWTNVQGKFALNEQWIKGKNYYRYLVDLHDFPLRKTKHLNIKFLGAGQCLKLLDDGYGWLLNGLSYPSAETMKKFHAAMAKAEEAL